MFFDWTDNKKRLIREREGFLEDSNRIFEEAKEEGRREIENRFNLSNCWADEEPILILR